MNFSKKIKPHIVVLLVVVAAVLLAAGVLFFAEYRYARQPYHPVEKPAWIKALHGHRPATVNDVPSVRAWMTFDYVDHLFALPPQYLQSKLKITDSRYPRLTIASYAAIGHLSQAAALAEVQDALRAYFTQQ